MLGPVDDVRHSRLPVGGELRGRATQGRRARSADYPTLVAVLQTLPQPTERRDPVGPVPRGTRSVGAQGPRRTGPQLARGVKVVGSRTVRGSATAQPLQERVPPRPDPGAGCREPTEAIGGEWSSDRSTSSQVTSETSSGTPDAVADQGADAAGEHLVATGDDRRRTRVHGQELLGARSPCSAESDPTRLIVSSVMPRDVDRLGHAGDPLADRPQVQGPGDEGDPSMAQVQQVPDGRPHARPMVVADHARAEFGRDVAVDHDDRDVDLAPGRRASPGVARSRARGSCRPPGGPGRTGCGRRPGSGRPRSS